jgi:hypothetical protein
MDERLEKPGTDEPGPTRYEEPCATQCLEVVGVSFENVVEVAS